VAIDNAASIRILEKSGFTEERESNGEKLMRLVLRPREAARPTDPAG
jgi:RimJ/RimL family protein N-acetyltransferase